MCWTRTKSNLYPAYTTRSAAFERFQREREVLGEDDIHHEQGEGQLK
jgi:hypothetical protein